MGLQRPRIALIDYGAGNLRSIGRALALAGADVSLVAQPPANGRYAGLVLPGVGAFGAAMTRLQAAGLPDWIRGQVAADVPLVGICLGMQLLFGRSEESPEATGLDLLAGAVKRLPPGLKVPHMGWNQLIITQPSALLADVPDSSDVYFVHSYVACPRDGQDIIATTAYGQEFAAMIQRGRLAGLQFHPEKSGEVGQQLLRNIVAWIGAEAHAGTLARPR